MLHEIRALNDFGIQLDFCPPFLSISPNKFQILHAVRKDKADSLILISYRVVVWVHNFIFNPNWQNTENWAKFLKFYIEGAL